MVNFSAYYTFNLGISMENDSVLEISQRQPVSMVCMHRDIQHCRNIADNLPALVSEKTGRADSLIRPGNIT